ncbi:hypothetical protein CAOG_02296 [Capsaspora owczarzaki ATCC 30864]|uniref:Uncharacterized protein n=1 Tax=Capsaspora owczarzaki (strain ATCC 30864) TaxID=595528 RepID=A0A0D2WL11_CAPO3|nr:hypothetical protein CAOG_02296 [Capsaspora owczarzaki ATCC 30864]KJE91110.1 hypothetical protein CAOG_002296 [Capsaspora owczarzaki ATCC 30864]|eukprot:XP_004349046.1 hypothetical protein CAOG_02296 [Capsaspora owczarzaki ATCC 30864]
MSFFKTHFGPSRYVWGLHATNHAVFTSSTYLPQWAFVLYRFLQAGYSFGWLVSLIVHSDDNRWLIYLTNWSYLLLATYFALAFIGAALHWFHGWPTATDQLHTSTSQLSPDSEKSNQMRMSEPNLAAPTGTRPTVAQRLLWVLYLLATDAAVTVVILYWGLVFDSATTDVSEYNISEHAINGVQAVVEMLVADMPHRLAHLYFLFTYGIAYMILTLIWWGADGVTDNGTTYIYKVLDYDATPGKAAMYLCLVLLIGLPVIHFVLSGLVATVRERFLRRQVPSVPGGAFTPPQHGQ